jgi:hypothetical protein
MNPHSTNIWQGGLTLLTTVFQPLKKKKADVEVLYSDVQLNARIKIVMQPCTNTNCKRYPGLLLKYS